MMSPELIVSSLARSTAGVFHTPPRARQLARRRLEPRGRESRATANASRGTQALSRARRDGRVPEIERSSTRIESLNRARANSTEGPAGRRRAVRVVPVLLIPLANCTKTYVCSVESFYEGVRGARC